MAMTRHDPSATVQGPTAILVDAQTVPAFLAAGGLEPILEEIGKQARVVVRRAHGRWFEPEIRDAQRRLARLGFELIHTFAPLPTNRPSTVQLVVDAPDLAGRADPPSRVVLVSAECDLAPLTRRWQQIGPRVMVVGPRGVADRTVAPCSDKVVLFERPPAAKASATTDRPSPRPEAEKARRSRPDGPTRDDAATVRAVVAAWPDGPAMTDKASLVNRLRERLAGTVDDRALRRALSAHVKSRCLRREDAAPAAATGWRLLPGLTPEDALRRIDEAMAARLREACEAYDVAWRLETARSLRLMEGAPP